MHNFEIMVCAICYLIGRKKNSEGKKWRKRYQVILVNTHHKSLPVKNWLTRIKRCFSPEFRKSHSLRSFVPQVYIRFDKFVLIGNTSFLNFEPAMKNVHIFIMWERNSKLNTESNETPLESRTQWIFLKIVSYR